MKLPAFTVPVRSLLPPAFSTPTSHRVLVLVLGAILTTGRRTITHSCRTVRPHAQRHVPSSERVCSPRRWSPGELARRWLTVLLTYRVPMGPVLLAGDETVAERPGPHVFGQGRHRDGVRSPQSATADRWGPTWVVWSVLVQGPLALRPWALPVVAAWSRAPAWAQAHGRRHKTPAHLARRLLARVVRWFPERPCLCVGDTGDGTRATARFCHRDGRHLTSVRKDAGDAA